MPSIDRKMVSIKCLQRSLLCALVIGVGTAKHAFAQSSTDSVQPTSSSKSTADAETSGEKPNVDEKHPLFLPLVVAYKAKDALKNVGDYECDFTKRELIGKKLVKTSMRLKLREDPFSVYLKFIDNNPGREVLYVKGQNNGNLLVREAGIKSIVGMLSLPPTGPDAMAESRYPVTQIGLKQMLETIISQWEAEGKFGGVTTQKRPDSKTLTGEVCTVYEAIHAKQFKEFKFHTTRLWIDDATGMAIGVQQLGFPGKKDSEPPIVEEYFYGKIESNLKMTNKDFDKNNPKYSFLK
jgi:hypothetical protein